MSYGVSLSKNYLCGTDCAVISFYLSKMSQVVYIKRVAYILSLTMRTPLKMSQAVWQSSPLAPAKRLRRPTMERGAPQWKKLAVFPLWSPVRQAPRIESLAPHNGPNGGTGRLHGAAALTIIAARQALAPRVPFCDGALAAFCMEI